MFADVITQRDNANNYLIALADIQVTVKIRNADTTYSAAPVYAARTGSTQIGSNGVFITTDGRVEFWAEPGSYELTFSDILGQNRISPSRRLEWESIPNDDARLAWLPGMMVDWCSTTAPAGFLLCDGSTISQSTYPLLYAAIGTTYNTGGESAGTRRLPDFRGRSSMGNGTGTGLTARTIGARLGEENHILTTGEMPSHDHSTFAQPTSVNVAAGGGFGVTPASGASTTGATGGGTSHNTVHPVLVVPKIIKHD